eukprot:Em0009g1249a
MATRWGICGSGRIAHDFVAALQSLPESQHQVVAVAARSLDSATKFAREHRIPRAYGSYENLARDEGVDAVYVATINTTHLQSSLQMIEGKKPVLCEKSLTMNAKETATLIKAARDGGVLLMEGIWMRFFPAMLKLKSMIDEGAIGQVKYVSASLGISRPDAVERQQITDPERGGGGILAVGVYVINFATMVFGGDRPQSIHTSGWLADSGVDDFAAITLKYSGERVAQLTSTIGINLKMDAIVVGTKGTLKVPFPFWCPSKLETPAGTLEFPLPSHCQPVNFRNSQGLVYEAEGFRECLLKGQKESDHMTLDHTQIVSDIMDEVMRQLDVVYYRKS